MEVLAWILVGLADILFVFSMLSKKKNMLVLFLIISDILFASHYLCLGGLTGAINIFVDAVYLIVIFILEKTQKEKYNLPVTVVAMALTIVLSILTWSSAISLLPMFSMLIYFTGMIFKNIVIVKVGALARNTLNITYMLLIPIPSYLGAGLEVCLMISAIIGIILNLRKLKTKESIGVAEENI